MSPVAASMHATPPDDYQTQDLATTPGSLLGRRQRITLEHRKHSKRIKGSPPPPKLARTRMVLSGPPSLVVDDYKHCSIEPLNPARPTEDDTGPHQVEPSLTQEENNFDDGTTPLGGHTKVNSGAMTCTDLAYLLSMDGFVGAIRLRDGLFLGDQLAATDHDFFNANVVLFVINCCHSEVPNHFHNLAINGQRIQYLSFSWKDAEGERIYSPRGGTLKKIFEFIECADAIGASCLIHSKFGKSRSVCTVCGYLMLRYRWSAKKALEFLIARRPDLTLRRSFVRQILSIEHYLTEELNCEMSTSWDEKVPSLSDEELLLRNTFKNSFFNSFQSSKSDYFGLAQPAEKQIALTKHFSKQSRITWKGDDEYFEEMHPPGNLKAVELPGSSLFRPILKSRLDSSISSGGKSTTGESPKVASAQKTSLSQYHGSSIRVAKSQSVKSDSLRSDRQARCLATPTMLEKTSRSKMSSKLLLTDAEALRVVKDKTPGVDFSKNNSSGLAKGDSGTPKSKNVGLASLQSSTSAETASPLSTSATASTKFPKICSTSTKGEETRNWRLFPESPQKSRSLSPADPRSSAVRLPTLNRTNLVSMASLQTKSHPVGSETSQGHRSLRSPLPDKTRPDTSKPLTVFVPAPTPPITEIRSHTKERPTKAVNQKPKQDLSRTSSSRHDTIFMLPVGQQRVASNTLEYRQSTSLATNGAVRLRAVSSTRSSLPRSDVQNVSSLELPRHKTLPPSPLSKVAAPRRLLPWDQSHFTHFETGLPSSASDGPSTLVDKHRTSPTASYSRESIANLHPPARGRHRSLSPLNQKSLMPPSRSSAGQWPCRRGRPTTEQLPTSSRTLFCVPSVIVHCL